MPISAEDKIYKKIAPTRDTHANWTLHNPVLPEGVIGAVKDRVWSGNLEFVMGDGTRPYTELLTSGAIIESGSNANGSYVKWADGTMICSALLELDGVVVTNDDGAPIPWTLPAVYIDINYKLFCSAIGYASNRFYVTFSPQSTSDAQGGAISITGQTWTLNASSKLSIISFGRWKA